MSGNNGAWEGRLRRRGPPPCLILELPDAILELILSLLRAWHLGQSAAVCKAFSEHKNAATEMRAAHLDVSPQHVRQSYKRTLTNSSFCKSLLKYLHLHEIVGAWHSRDLDNCQGATDGNGVSRVTLLENRPSGARLALVAGSNGYLDFRHQYRAPGKCAIATALSEEMDEELMDVDYLSTANLPLPTQASPMTPPYTLAEWLFKGARHFGNWRFDIRKDGVELICTEDTSEDALPSLLTADGALLKKGSAAGGGVPIGDYVHFDSDDDDDDE